jgi:hypothetical protein
MVSRPGGIIPAAPRKTLLEWIEHEDGDTPETPHPICSARERELHAALVAKQDADTRDAEPLCPPAGLRLAPLG